MITRVLIALLLLCGTAHGGSMIPWMIANSGAVLKFHALAPDPTTYEMTGVLKGVGSMTVARTTMQYVLDADGVYQTITANNPAWYGARYSGGVAYGDDGAGNLLSPTPMLQVDPALTNSLTYSSDLTNAAWTATNTITAYTSVGLTGAPNAATRLTATAGNATVIRAAATVAASATHATRWFIKRITGTGTIELTLDNGSTWQDITADVGAGYTSIAVEQATLTGPQVGIRLVTSGDAVDVGNVGLFTEKTIAQVRGSGPIFTTTAAVSTGAQTTSFDIANHSDVNGAYYLEASPFFTYPLNPGHAFLAVGSYLLNQLGNESRLRAYDGTATAASPLFSHSLGETLQMGLVYGNGKMVLNLDGVYGNTVNYDGAFNGSSIQVGVGPTYYSCLYRNLRIYWGGPNDQRKLKIDELMP